MTNIRIYIRISTYIYRLQHNAATTDAVRGDYESGDPRSASFMVVFKFCYVIYLSFIWFNPKPLKLKHFI